MTVCRTAPTAEGEARFSVCRASAACVGRGGHDSWCLYECVRMRDKSDWCQWNKDRICDVKMKMEDIPTSFSKWNRLFTSKGCCCWTQRRSWRWVASFRFSSVLPHLLPLLSFQSDERTCGDGHVQAAQDQGWGAGEPVWIRPRSLRARFALTLSEDDADKINNT